MIVNVTIRGDNEKQLLLSFIFKRVFRHDMTSAQAGRFQRAQAQCFRQSLCIRQTGRDESTLQQDGAFW